MEPMVNCYMCAKRVPPVNEVMCKCKCGLVYCLTHRLPEKHECLYKYIFDPSKLQPCVAPKMNERA